MIDLHYVATPNGYKVALMLEEVGIPYNIIAYDIFEGDHLKPEFGRINPNYKLPAIVDHSPADSGRPFSVFESGAILQYLAEKTGKMLPTDARGRSLAIQWLTWQVASLGPMGGQATHFVRYAPRGQEYAIRRYGLELRRLMTVLNRRLSAVDYLAGEYSLADIACWPGRFFAANQNYLGIDQSSEFPAIRAWCDRIAERPAAVAILLAEHLRTPEKYARSRQRLTARQWSNLFGSNMLGAVKE